MENYSENRQFVSESLQFPTNVIKKIITKIIIIF